MANTGTVIELSPEQLAQQGQEMLKLKSSYESLFQGMLSDLQGINSGVERTSGKQFYREDCQCTEEFFRRYENAAKRQHGGADVRQ